MTPHEALSEREPPMHEGSTVIRNLASLANSTLVALACVALGVVTAGCQSNDRGQIAGMLLEMRDAYVQRDYASACTHMTRAAQRAIGYVGHGRPTTCKKDMSQRMRADVLSKGDLSALEIQAIEIDDDSARADVAIGSRGTVSTRFAREEGEWKLDSLLGARGPTRPPPRTLPSGPSPGPAVEVSPDGARRVCPPLHVGKINASGGCELLGTGLMTLTTLNVLGDRRYARCPVTFTVLMNAEGQIVFNVVDMGVSPDTADVCGDIVACRNSDGEGYLWQGRVVAQSDGTLHARVPNFCFDTCIGRFGGQVTFDALMDRAGRLHLSVNSTSLGASGLLLTGRWRLAPTRGNLRLAFDN